MGNILQISYKCGMDIMGHKIRYKDKILQDKLNISMVHYKFNIQNYMGHNEIKRHSIFLGKG